MREQKDTESDLSSIISYDEDGETNLSSYMSVSKFDKPPSINLQSEEKAKA